MHIYTHPPQARFHNIYHKLFEDNNGFFDQKKLTL